jgi:replicative superfamily II helicase
MLTVDNQRSLRTFLQLDENIPRLIREILERQGINYLRAVQILAIQGGLLDEASLLVCSPSASGKTLVGELAILKWVLQGGKAVYMVPLKALAREKFGMLVRKYRDLNLRIRISTGDFHYTPNILEDADILVTTIERFDSLLRLNPGWLYNIRVIVVDEIHVMGDEHRGGRLESVLIRIRERLRVQLIGLSATIANAGEIADWLKCRLVESDTRPVPLKNYILVENNKLEAIRKLVSATIQNNGQVLIFVAQRRHTESLSRKLVKSVIPNLAEEERETLSSRFIESRAYPTRLIELMRQGVGFHHAGLNYASRELVEDAFRNGFLRVVCCTTTLSAGIDAPARLVILRDFYVFNQVEMATGEFEIDGMNANQLHQILGRAGRPDFDSVGYGVIMCNSDSDRSMVLKKYFEIKDGELFPRYDAVKSSISFSPNLEEQTLLRIFELEEANEKDVMNFFEKTFWWRKEKSKNPQANLERSIKLGSMNIPEAIKCLAKTSELRGAEKIGDESLRVQLMQNKVEATVTEPVVNVCSFHEKRGSLCTCSRQNVEPGVLCRHLVKLAQVVDQNFPIYRGLVSGCLNADNVLKKLRDEGLVTETTLNTFNLTGFGKLIIRLYLKPATGILIRSKVHGNIDDDFGFMELVLSAVELEYERPQPQLMSVAVLDYLRGKSVREVSSLYRISQGDLESVIGSLNWMIHCVAEIADMEGAKTVKRIGKSLEERIENRRREKDFEIWS